MVSGPDQNNELNEDDGSISLDKAEANSSVGQVLARPLFLKVKNFIL